MSQESVVDGTKLVIRRTFAAPVEKVYRAWTEPARMAKWLSSNPRWKAPTIETEMHVGGRHNIAMNHTDGDTFHIFGEYTEIVPNERIGFTWKWLESPTGPEESLVTVTFRAVSGGTELTLTHDRINDPTMRDETRKGWIGCLEMLDLYLDGKEPLAS